MGALRYPKSIIKCLLSIFIAFFSFFSCCINVQAEDGESYTEVSSYDEFTSSLDQMQAAGGTVVLTQDITVPAEESYVYINARYRNEVVIEANGHTIYVEGYLELWPFLTIYGDGGQKELFHVSPGGDLRLVSVCLDAGENGVAVVQEEGSFLVYGSEEDMGLPAFSCTGQIISSSTITAAADWRYNCERLPVVRIPDGADFTTDMLPDKVLSIVNRDHQEYEEEVPVVWEEATFPTEHERALVQGKFAQGYSQYEDYMPQCLVIWESDTSPFFLNVYLESATSWSDMVFMYGESPRPGTVYIQSSDDGETWTDIAGTDGYAPVEAEEDGSFFWILSYDRSEPAQERPKYYRLLQVSDDGTELYSAALELNDGLIFTAADIEGGRGGETSPNEGENQLPNSIQKPQNGNEALLPESSEPSSESSRPESDIEAAAPEEPMDETEESESHSDAESTEEPSESNASSSATTLPNETVTGAQPIKEEETGQKTEFAGTTDKPLAAFKTDGEILDSTDTEKIVGIVIVVCILLGSVAFFVLKQKS